MIKLARNLCIILLCAGFISLQAEEPRFRIQINKSEQLIKDVEKYFWGEGFKQAEGQVFFSPIVTSFINTVQQLEPMIGIKGQDILKLLNGDLDIQIINQDLKAKLQYATPERTLEVMAVIKQFYASKGISLTETKAGEATNYTAKLGPKTIYIFLLSNRIFVQSSNDEISNDDKIQVHRAISPILKYDTDSYISIDINNEFLSKNQIITDELGPMQSFFDGGIKNTISFKDGYYSTHSDMSIPKLKIFTHLLSNNPINKQALNLIAKDAEFALLYKMDLSKILEAIASLNELESLKNIQDNIDMVKAQIKQVTSVDIQTDLLNHLGEEIVISSIPDAEAGGMPLFGFLGLNNLYFAATLKNGLEVEKTITKILTSLGQINSLSPIATIKDGLKEIKVGEYKIQYIKFAQSILTPCFLVKDNAIYIANNVATLTYIANNSGKWGSIDKNLDFQSKIPLASNINAFAYTKYTDDKNRTNYSSQILNSLLFGGILFVNYMGNEKIMPGSDGAPFRQAAAMLKPLVSEIDFALYPANKSFYQENKDNYFYCKKEGNQLHSFSKNGHLLNAGSSNYIGIVFVTSVVATVALPNLMSAQRNARERSVIATLRSVHADQEGYKNDHNTYTTLEKLAAQTGMVNLPSPKTGSPKSGYYYTDLIKSPTQDFYAVLASPSAFGSSGSKHYVVTSVGKVFQFEKETFPYKDLEANQESIDLLMKLDEAR